VQLNIVVTQGSPVGGIKRATAQRDGAVLIRVTSDAPDVVHVEGYDVSARVMPGSPAILEFLPDMVGRFKIELKSENKQIGEVIVE
jgi:hypothetical protein